MAEWCLNWDYVPGPKLSTPILYGLLITVFLIIKLAVILHELLAFPLYKVLSLNLWQFPCLEKKNVSSQIKTVKGFKAVETGQHPVSTEKVFGAYIKSASDLD